MREHGGGGAARNQFVEMAVVSMDLHRPSRVGSRFRDVSRRTVAWVGLSWPRQRVTDQVRAKLQIDGLICRRELRIGRRVLTELPRRRRDATVRAKAKGYLLCKASSPLLTPGKS